MGFGVIRSANENDIEKILDLASDFWLETEFKEPFCRDHTRGMVELSLGCRLLAVVDVGEVVGFCAGVCSPLLAAPSAMVGTELAWWVDPAHRSGKNGIGLLVYMEDLARKAGVKYWTMISMQSSMPDQIEKMYLKMGYKKTETSFLKVM